MHQTHRYFQLVAQRRVTANCGRIIVVQIDFRTHPECALSAPYRTANCANDFIKAGVRYRACLHRDASCRLFIENRNVEIAMYSLGEGPRNRCGAHDQHVRAERLASEFHSIRNAKPVLFVDNHKTEIAEIDCLLEQ